MANKDGSGNSWQDKLLTPAILLMFGGVVTLISAKDAPWWVSSLPDPTPSPTVALELSPTPEPSAPELTPTPAASPTPELSPASILTPAPAAVSASQEIRKQGYIFRLQDCRSTGEVGGVVCDFTVEAESDQKKFQIAARQTFLLDTNGQMYHPSRIEFGNTGSSNSVTSSLEPGALIRGAALFSDIPPGMTFFQAFELSGKSTGKESIEATFRDISLGN